MREPLPSEFVAALDYTRERRGRFGSTIHYHAEVGSTNDEAARLAENGAAEGTTVFASAQTAGRGRLGRLWFSPPGAGLYVSVVIRSRTVAPFLTLAGGIAVADGIRAATGLPVEIKWPNDVVVNAGLGRRRKLAGVLAEASTADELQYVVLGFGINLRPAAYPPDIADRASSLEGELGRVVDAGVVLAESLAHMAAALALLERGQSSALLEWWSRLSPCALGTPVEWDTPDGPRSGRTAGIAADGALLVRSGDRIERIISGIVRWV